MSFYLFSYETFFIANVVPSPLQNSGSIVEKRNDLQNSFQGIVKLVNDSNVLQKTVKAKCIEVISSTMKSAKDQYFNVHGYSTVIARKTCDVSSVLESAILPEMKEAYVKQIG